MDVISKKRFSVILADAMVINNIGATRLEGLLRDRGVENITYKRISEYANGLHTPSFEKARALMQTLEYDISDDELMETLRLNREKINEEKESIYDYSREIRRTIRIRLRPLLPGHTAEETERFLWNRINELCGEHQISLYIQNLIKKDLQEYIISREEITQDEK